MFRKIPEKFSKVFLWISEGIPERIIDGGILTFSLDFIEGSDNFLYRFQLLFLTTWRCEIFLQFSGDVFSNAHVSSLEEPQLKTSIVKKSSQVAGK